MSKSRTLSALVLTLAFALLRGSSRPEPPKCPKHIGCFPIYPGGPIVCVDPPRPCKP